MRVMGFVYTWFDLDLGFGDYKIAGQLPGSVIEYGLVMYIEDNGTLHALPYRLI